jgi:hypothetical protein
MDWDSGDFADEIDKFAAEDKTETNENRDSDVDTVAETSKRQKV